LQGGFFFGYKIDRFLFGLGIDLDRFATSSSSSGNPDASQSTTGLLLLPGVRIAALRSSDERVELYGEFDLGWGHAFTDQSPAPMGQQPQKSNNRLVYQLGPGVRYWIH